MPADPLLFYRVRCGRKVWSHWCDSEIEAMRLAVEHGLGHFDDRGQPFLGPLVWIEIGQRRYRRSRTVPMRERLDGSPLYARNRPSWWPSPDSAKIRSRFGG